MIAKVLAMLAVAMLAPSSLRAEPPASVDLERLARLMDSRVRPPGRPTVETKAIYFDRVAVPGIPGGVRCWIGRKNKNARECDISESKSPLRPDDFGAVALLCTEPAVPGGAHSVYRIQEGPLAGTIMSYRRFPDGTLEVDLTNAEWALRGIPTAASSCLARRGLRGPVRDD